MNKELIVPKWVLIAQPKIPQMPQNLSAQFVGPTPKVLDFNERRLHWASVVCALSLLDCMIGFSVLFVFLNNFEKKIYPAVELLCQLKR